MSGKRLPTAAWSSDSQSGLTEGTGNDRPADGDGFSQTGGTARAAKPVESMREKPHGSPKSRVQSVQEPDAPRDRVGVWWEGLGVLRVCWL